MKVSFVGYKTICKLVPIARIGNVRMQANSYLLKGVTVEAARVVEKVDRQIIFPTKEQVKNAENVLLMGTRDASYGDTIATTWTHVADYATNAPEYAWNYLDLDANQGGKMPMMNEVLTCAADTGFVALGSNGNWYKSKNNGLTWAVDSLITLPAEFKANTGRFGFCRDANNFYWVIRNGYVWKGRYNIDGWRKN